jgi:hypothetical protein
MRRASQSRPFRHGRGTGRRRSPGAFRVARARRSYTMLSVRRLFLLPGGSMSEPPPLPTRVFRRSRGARPAARARLAFVTGASARIASAPSPAVGRDAWDLVLVARRREAPRQDRPRACARKADQVDVLAADIRRPTGARGAHGAEPTLELVVTTPASARAAFASSSRRRGGGNPPQRPRCAPPHRRVGLARAGTGSINGCSPASTRAYTATYGATGR